MKITYTNQNRASFAVELKAAVDYAARHNVIQGNNDLAYMANVTRGVADVVGRLLEQLATRGALSKEALLEVLGPAFSFDYNDAARADADVAAGAAHEVTRAGIQGHFEVCTTCRDTPRVLHACGPLTHPRAHVGVRFVPEKT